jgi:hypothetical protein
MLRCIRYSLYTGHYMSVFHVICGSMVVYDSRTPFTFAVWSRVYKMRQKGHAASNTNMSNDPHIVTLIYNYMYYWHELQDLADLVVIR